MAAPATPQQTQQGQQAAAVTVANPSATVTPTIVPQETEDQAEQPVVVASTATAGTDVKVVLPKAGTAETVKSANENRTDLVSSKGVEKAGTTDVVQTTMPVAETAKSVLSTYENKAVDPARLAEGRPTQLLQQVSQGLETLQASGKTSLRMQLYPDSLGRVDLHLTNTSDGVRVTISADLASTGKLLERHLDDLKNSLSHSGVNVVGLAVGHGNEQRDANSQTSQHGKEGPIFAPSAVSAPAQEEESTTSTGRSLTSSYIDYRI